MNDNYSLSYVNDGEDEIHLIEITQAQYNQYSEEAEYYDMDIHEYIELAMEHEFIAEEMGLEDLDETTS